MVPLSIKCVDSISPYVPEDILALCWSTRSAQPLLNHLSALIIQHALMSHLLVPITAVMIHLMAL